ncbi:hypothetical protein GCM10014713_50930 [Streptomyces purpureus]|uniref:Uncharacterized protein n=1 Tax=Streptomyces purpureus TaxID=1951 RepID=A0A918HC92_9ACTN|nr:hypothetical protein GCM10014713_50930 [Streptomyces purpureus]
MANRSPRPTCWRAPAASTARRGGWYRARAAGSELLPDLSAEFRAAPSRSASLHPIEGAEQIARFFADRTLPGRLAVEECTVNGQPGLAAHLDGAVLSVYAFDITDGRIRRIWAVLNPEKLRPWKRR